VALNPSALVAPLGGGYVTLAHQEYLVATALDPSLRLRSAPLGLSLDRRASLAGLVFAPDGSATAALYTDGDGLKFATLACADEPPPPPGPAQCPVSDVVEPLDPGCEGPVCHVALRLDYRTLAPLGHATTSGDASAVDATVASQAARAVFDADGEYLSTELTMTGPAAGLFTAYISPGDFGAFALVGEASGAVVAAGGVVWSGRGRYWAPDTWKTAAGVACGRDTVVPAETYVDPGDCPDFTTGQAPSTDGNDALAVALRTNLARHMAARGPLSAFVYLYTPTVGGCDPSSAEYLVVLTQGP
jgi:hypothetical protein